MSDTPRVAELKRAIRKMLIATDNEERWAWRDALHCGIDELERELAAVTEERDALAAAIKLKEEQFDALLESRRNVAQDRKDAVERAEKAEAECERLRKDAERWAFARDHLFVSRSHPLQGDTDAWTMDEVIFGPTPEDAIDAAMRKP